MMLKPCIHALMIFALASCGGAPDDISQRRPEWAAEIASFPADTFTKAGLQARYANATFLDYSVPHGTQIEHLAADGTAYLWYPGNTRIVVGRWRAEDPVGNSRFGRICFAYGPNTYNPVTRQAGGSFNCVSADAHIIYEDEYTRGDPFNLSSGQLPYVLRKDKRYTLAEAGTPLGL